MNIPRTTAALAVAAIAFAGCGGGDDSNKTLSYSEFGQKADEICNEANPEIKAIGAKLNGDPANDAPLLGQVQPKLEAANTKFKELKPPKELEPAFKEFTSITDQQIELTKQAKATAESGDQAAYVEQVKQIGKLGDQSDLAASKMGAKACATS